MSPRLILIFWGVLPFAGSGFEHVVANMTAFSLGLFEDVPGVTVGAFTRNLLFVGLGNLVGELLVGTVYAFAGRRAPTGTVRRERPGDDLGPVLSLVTSAGPPRLHG
ncbi:formate/nitrite transporter family protein [Streptomyces sp. DSM 110735]|uniref:formate/nitrite transporter family protein n=1 Tax=Streptomyces sp. DSM 110735 TaxID=2775031 RepID=UPI0018F5DA53|nr:formate/nitrite transporter family protein [Streptomyces sp. DSM 110735]MBJ7905676.1 formate/nitrite transporter family protein [Streptomyces sp. DSM 110735]